MIVDILEETGLTKGESKVYLALLELGLSKSGPIIKKSRLQSSVVYNCLKSLTEKGLVNSILKGKVKEYSAVPPEILIDLLEEKKAKLKEVLPMLREAKNKEKQEAKVYYGIKGIKTAHLEQIKEAQKMEEYLFFSLENEYYNEEIKTFLIHFNNLRKNKGMVVKALIKINPAYAKIFDKEFTKAGIKFRKVKQTIPVGSAIVKDTVLKIVWDPEEPIAFLLKSKKFAQEYRDFFYTLWKEASTN